MPLLLYIKSLMPGDSAAPDVAQQANSTIWQKRSDFVPGTNFKAWAFSIARFEVLTHRKQSHRENKVCFHPELEQLIEDELVSASDNLLERHDALRTCLGTLRRQDRELLLYRYSSRGTLEEFAQSVGRSVSGIKVTLHRLRNSLADCMNRKIGVGSGHS